MDRSEPSVLVVSRKGALTEEWIQRAAARAVPVLCEGADGDDLPEDIVSISSEPTKAMQGFRPFWMGPTLVRLSPLRAMGTAAIGHHAHSNRRPSGLLRLLDRLGAQDLHRVYSEVIVVDDASDNHASDVIVIMHIRSSFRSIENPKPGSGHARNVGLMHARAATAVFFDDDTMPSIDNLRGHLLMQHATDQPHLITGSFELVDSEGTLSMTQEAIQSVAFDLRDLRPNGPSEPEGFCV